MPTDEQRPSDADLPPFGVRRGARTTHRRGRMTAGKWSVIDDLGPDWMLSVDDLGDGRDLSSHFDEAPVSNGRADGESSSASAARRRLLDIGVGNGTATVDWARRHPDDLAVAVELHQPGIVAFLQMLDADGPPNVRIVEADVEQLLERLAPATFTDVRILFPDPWPKKRHTKRRLVDERLIKRVADLLPVGGTLHLATDWVDYADQMRRALATEPRLAHRVDIEGEPAVDPSGEPVTAPRRWRTHRPERPVTAYEQRGLAAGRAITDLVAVRT
ncbi:MAG: tRNA (guanosine(46)-N7)-methyltransferase TrmB [Aquihabitans sp.]